MVSLPAVLVAIVSGVQPAATWEGASDGAVDAASDAAVVGAAVGAVVGAGVAAPLVQAVATIATRARALRPVTVRMGGYLSSGWNSRRKCTSDPVPSGDPVRDEPKRRREEVGVASGGSDRVVHRGAVGTTLRRSDGPDDDPSVRGAGGTCEAAG